MQRTYELVYQVDASQALPTFAKIHGALHGAEQDAHKVAAAFAAITPAIAAVGNQANALNQSFAGLGPSVGAAHAHVTQATEGLAGFRGEAIAAAVAFKGLDVIVQIAAGIGEAINKARRNMAEMAEDSLKLREELRELANLKGKDGPDDQLTAETVGFGLKAGMTGKQAAKFLEQFEGSLPAGMQKHNIGDGIRDGETQEGYEARVRPIAEEVAQEAARTGQRIHLAPSTAGDLAGVLGQHQKIGSKDEGMRMIGRIVAGLNDGRGNMEALMKPFINIAGSLVDENEGPIGGDDELAAIYGVMSTHHNPREAGTYLKKGVRALRDFTGPQGEALGEMQITPQDSHIQALTKLHTRLEADRAAGVAPDQSLAQMGFNDSTDRQALIEETRNFKVIQQRLQDMEKITGKDVVDANDAFFARNKTGRNMMIDAEAEAVRFRRGAEHEDAQMARKAATARMLNDGSIFTGPETAIADKVLDYGGIAPALGVPTAMEQRINKEAVDHLIAEAQRTGLEGEVRSVFEERKEDGPLGLKGAPKYGMFDGKYNVNELAKDSGRVDRLFKDLAPQIRDRGGDPYGTAGGLRADLRHMARDPQKRAEAERFKNPTAPQGKAPRPPGAHPPGAAVDGLGVGDPAGEQLAAAGRPDLDDLLSNPGDAALASLNLRPRVPAAVAGMTAGAHGLGQPGANGGGKGMEATEGADNARVEQLLQRLVEIAEKDQRSRDRGQGGGMPLPQEGRGFGPQRA